ncbi:MASE1 domain-containing protein [Myxococcaceae bacterium GXIMD 01537]
MSYSASFFPDEAIAVWWAPSGLALATLIRADRRSIPWLLGAVLLATVAVNSAPPISLFQFLYRSLADILEPLTSALLLRRRFGRDMGLRTLREVLGFAVIGGLVGPAMGALLMVAVPPIANEPAASAGLFALLWFGSAVLGAVLLAPLFLAWRTPPYQPRGSRLLEAALLSVLLGA